MFRLAAGALGRLISPRRLALLLVPLAALWAAALPAQAAQVVFLSTTETAPGNTIVSNAETAFSDEASALGLTFSAYTDALSDPVASLSSYIGADTKLIVAVSVYSPIDSGRMSDLTSILDNNPNIAIVAFLDGCCSLPSNLDTFVTAVNATIRPTSWPTLGLGAVYSTAYTAYLNPNSAYQSSFSAELPSMAAAAYSPMTNVPEAYALYTQTNLTGVSSSPSSTVNDTVGLFIPQQASNKGAGACLFLMGDTSQFVATLTPAQNTATATAFITAATDPSGACKQAAVQFIPPSSSAAAVPTLNDWGPALLALLLMGLALAALRGNARR